MMMAGGRVEQTEYHSSPCGNVSPGCNSSSVANSTAAHMALCVVGR